MRKISTHVLDVAHGKPAAGFRVRLFREGAMLGEFVTNADGRTDSPLLVGDAVVAGEYRLEFDVGAYFAGLKHPDAGKFLGVVPVVFRIDDAAAGCHVPLLVSPWAYSTYRGS
jgi:5-hydroxyisourate hydrolase